MNVHHDHIPDAVRTAQARASDPTASVFVAANAGSGKTHVLVNRVIRLLLNDVPPEKILCITFTKAAAANMAQRVFETLGHWVTLSDSELDDAIRATGAPQPSAPLRKRARELFACALETPGGLKVQTIHALCTRLLQQFPFEANVPARFAVLDERDQNEMMERANLDVLLQAARDPGNKLGRALDTAMATAADMTFKDVVREACLSRDHFMTQPDNANSIDRVVARVGNALGIGRHDHIDDIDRAIVDGPHLPKSEWPSAAVTLDSGSESDRKQAARLREALVVSGKEQIDQFFSLFLTDKLEPRKSLVTKKISDSRPDFAQLLDREKDRVLDLLARRRAVRLRDRTQALLVIASAVTANYRREKQTRGLLDYDDLIDKTLAMLDNIASGWVHFKLDRGIDHILIDEAQDTSPRQWDIITRLAAEFTSGMGARDGIKRTIFAVGDEKQSIFSFQGAAPREFDTRRNEIRHKFEAAGLAFDPVSFTYSFRSGANVLQAVSSTFQAPSIYKSITTDRDGMPPHMALTAAAPGLIDVWDLEESDEKKKIEGWDAPFDTMSETSPEVRLARRVQSEIKTLIDDGALTGKGTPLRYGDIMVLVRRRGKAFAAVIQALKHATIPVAGADRLKLTEHIAIIDLMNLTDALLLPRDDLALAVALKSPLFGLDDDDLLIIAPYRKGSLRQALTDHATHSDRLRIALKRLEACEARFQQDTPFTFYAWLLGEHSGRARLLKRLGLEANDALDEFLELALSYEQKAPASLQGFMAWLRAADTDIKRDMEIRRDEVRVMTVHGAKGLEASVVFLVDTATSPTDTQRLHLIRLPQGNGASHAPDVVVWASRKTDDPPAVATARAAMIQESEDEYRRLLYVAMTRAADRLIVGGCLPGNRKEVRPDSWYGLIAQGLENSGLSMTEIQRSHGRIKRYARIDAPAPAAASTSISSDSEPSQESFQKSLPRQPLPAWLHTRVMAKAPERVLMRPSEMVESDSIVTAEPTETQARALQRGTLVHRLLQSLPEIALERRSEAARNFLARTASNPNIPDDKKWTMPECDALTAQVLALINEKKFAALFAPGSRAEVSLAGHIERPGRPPMMIAGQIDRLVVTDNQITIVDYKTNQTPPDSVASAPASYVRQLALYRAVLTKLYPGRPVRCVLLWTETIEIMEISASVLDAELTRIISTTNLDPARARS